MACICKHDLLAFWAILCLCDVSAKEEVRVVIVPNAKSKRHQIVCNLVAIFIF